MGMVVTNVDNGHVFIEQGEFGDNVLTSAAAATYLEGTILAVSTSTLKYVPFVKGGSTAGNGIPKAVLGYQVVAAAAGDDLVMPMETGKVQKERLVIHVDGDASNVDKAVMDQLRDFGLVVISQEQQSVLDNQ